MKFAAIDIGSNAVRLLFMQVFEYGRDTVFKKDALFRVPLRLGEDVFETGRISKEKAENLLHAMLAFYHLIKAYRPSDYMACATSAMREAKNGKEIVRLIKKKSGIDIQIIDGQREADIIYSNHFAETLDPKKAYLYVDVGGGSTEITLINDGKIADAHSFKIGTVRIIKGKVRKEAWGEMKRWLRQSASKFAALEGIGSGGNINTIFALSRNKRGAPISYTGLVKIYQYLRGMSNEARIRDLGLKPDRADVIVPAALIYTSIMEWTGIKKLYVPQIGLADGIIHLLYEKHMHDVLNFR
jgi:exopolyphosphatase / guanosine-5'-triphosphate,3'-diphosphate pyrophosphatase